MAGVPPWGYTLRNTIPSTRYSAPDSQPGDFNFIINCSLSQHPIAYTCYFEEIRGFKDKAPKCPDKFAFSGRRYGIGDYYLLSNRFTIWCCCQRSNYYDDWDRFLLKITILFDLVIENVFREQWKSACRKYRKCQKIEKCWVFYWEICIPKKMLYHRI